jgi:NADH-quinone oxidoreductase subunit L
MRLPALPHEAPRVMAYPLVVLAAGSLAGGVLLHGQLPRFLGAGAGSGEASSGHALNLAATTVAALGGLALALYLYVRRSCVPCLTKSRRFLVRLSWNQFYVDAFYTQVIARGLAVGAQVLHLVVEVLLIDGLLVHGTAWGARLGGRGLRVLHSGLLNAYALGLVAGLLAMLWYLLRV